MPHEIDLITDGKYGDATADLTQTARHFNTHLTPLPGEKKILFPPVFFGASKDGKITNFGRGGSDHAAAVAAVARIGIVGDGLQHRAGIAARCFTAVANGRVNVEMISSGPSHPALYFIVKKRALASGINAIHNTFFSISRCRRGA